MTAPNTDNTYPPPTPLIPDLDIQDGDTDDTFAGLPIIAARKQTRDAFNVLFYAYPGVGKTTIAGMFAGYPPACDVLVIDAEGGASVLAHLDNVYVLRVSRWDEVERIITQLERTPPDKVKYRTIVFDNLTELHAMLVQKIAGTRAVEIQEHGVITAALMRFTRRVRDLSRFRGINTALIAWQDNKEDKSRGITRQVVALTDKLSNRIPGIPNNVGYITVLNNPPLYTRKLSFAVTPLNDAKLRRASGDDASDIPLEIYYGLDANPIADMLRTIYEGVPFPSARYVRPKGRGKVASATNSASTEDTTEGDASDSA
jgi:phage nucleotide-binding protein